MDKEHTHSTNETEIDKHMLTWINYTGEITGDPWLLFPEDHKYLTFLKKVFRHELRKWGFRRISTPLLTKKSLYAQSGQEQYNDYSINDTHSLKFDHSLSILDTYLRYEQSEGLQPVYHYYMDRVFRLESGDLSEIHTIWWEIIWEKEPILDVECISIINTVLKMIWLDGKYTIKVNSAWLPKEQEKYREAFQDFYSDKHHLLSEESIQDLESNPLELWNPKTEDEATLLQQAPKMRKFLKKHSKAHLAKFEEFMEMLGVDYEYSHFLKWNKPYYMNTFWKIIDNETWKDLAYWGRYDALAMDISESTKEVPATGFSTRIGCMIELLKRNNICIKNKDKLDLYFVQLWDEAKQAVFPIATQARLSGINTRSSMGTPSIKEQMLKAQKSGATFVILVGIMEARNGLWQLRNLEKGTQTEIKKEEVIDYVINHIGKENLDFYSPLDDLIIWK